VKFLPHFYIRPPSGKLLRVSYDPWCGCLIDSIEREDGRAVSWVMRELSPADRAAVRARLTDEREGWAA